MMIWKILRGFLATLGFTVLVLAIMGAWGLRQSTPKLPAHFVLEITLNGTPSDSPAPDNFLASLFDTEARLAQTTDMITRAATDPRVEAIILKLGDGQYEWTSVQELRNALHDFRAKGKKVYAFADSYGDGTPGMGEYYLASAANEIWLQPVGNVEITGFQAESPYIKGLLDRIGVRPQMFQSGDYKTGAETMLRTSMSDAERETMRGILSSQMTDFFEAVSQSRDMAPSQIGILIDGAPYTETEALARKLIDRVGYYDELLTQLESNHDRAKTLVDTQTYLAAPYKSAPTQQSVAIIHINGMIVPQDIYGGVFSEPIAAADTIAAQINAAAGDSDISAIILRVVSPGGSPTASETIRRTVQTAKDAGKYVVVSMGSVAASGGYWVSVDADRIFALDGTITGSIGVFGGKMDLSGLWKHLDVNWDGVKLGANAGMWSPNAPFTPDGELAAQRSIDVIDDAFIQRVATGRGYAPDIIRPLAGGRVWTGRQAKDNGLIDEIGGLNETLDHVAKHLGLPSRHSLYITTPHHDLDPFKSLSGMFRGVHTLVSPYVGAWIRAQNPSLNAAYMPLSR